MQKWHLDLRPIRAVQQHAANFWKLLDLLKKAADLHSVDGPLELQHAMVAKPNFQPAVERYTCTYR